MAFNPNEHLMKLKGKDYLEVRYRLVWFRDEHPPESGWGIQTKCLSDDGAQAVFHATITDPEGRIVATGTKQESQKDFGDFREKAETGAVGRALGMLGYGTQFAPEFDEGERVVDSPVTPKQTAQPQQPAGNPAANQKVHQGTLATLFQEAKRREGGWEPVKQYLIDCNYNVEQLKGKRSAETEGIIRPYLVDHMTNGQAETIIAALKLMPFRSANNANKENNA